MDPEAELQRYVRVGGQVCGYFDREMSTHDISAVDLARQLCPRIGVNQKAGESYIRALRGGDAHHFLGNGNNNGTDAQRLWRLGVLLQVLGADESEPIVGVLREEYGPLFRYPPGERSEAAVLPGRLPANTLERKTRQLMPMDKAIVLKVASAVTKDELERIIGVMSQSYEA